MQSNKGAGEKQKKRVSKPVLKHRSSRSEIFCKKCFLRNFAKFTGNTCARVSFLLKLQNNYKKAAHFKRFNLCLLQISRWGYYLSISDNYISRQGYIYFEKNIENCYMKKCQ